MQKLYIMAHKIMRFGWQPDLPDQRDFAYKTPAAFIKALPSKVDLRKSCPLYITRAILEAALPMQLALHLNLK
jgi:hypothetical protein